jgi:molybdopterin-synthase adenylyltransferase
MRRPRVKPEHAPYRIADGRIRIGGMTYGIAAEVTDPNGSVWTLLQSMDGHHSVDEIVAQVVQTHPGESAETVHAAVQRFVEAGYVEDIGAADPEELTGQDKERYDRGRAYFRWLDLTPRASTWEPQVALRRARVTVIGMGGTGGVAAMALAASGVGQLRCVDSDVVELSNLNRQVLGGFNRSSQHLDHGGVRWVGARRHRWRGPRACGGSGRRIGHCGRRCGLRDGRSRLVRCSGTSGGGSRRE